MKDEIKKLRTEALSLMKQEKFTMRSCWNCNPAHEHLKEYSIPIICFECGHWFFKGIDITE